MKRELKHLDKAKLYDVPAHMKHKHSNILIKHLCKLLIKKIFTYLLCSKIKIKTNLIHKYSIRTIIINIFIRLLANAATKLQPFAKLAKPTALRMRYINNRRSTFTTCYNILGCVAMKWC